jgi:putative serine protease PepD
MTDESQDPTPGEGATESQAETQAQFTAPTQDYSAPAEQAAATQPVASEHPAAPAEQSAAATRPLASDQFAAPEQSAAARQPQASEHTWTSAPAEHPAAATQPVGSDYPSPPVAPAGPKRSYSTASIVATLAAVALVGGVSGAGVATWAASNNQAASSSVSSAPHQNVTINNTDNVNVISAVAAKASPSVVTISVSSSSASGTGSGVVLSTDGYILTNTHVVTLDGAISNPTVQVTTFDGHLYDATVVGTDPIVDLAVIKLKNASGLTPAVFADSSKLNVGETAIAIGAPLGLNNTVTDGIVSALNRSISIASSAVPNSSGQDSSPNSNSPFNFLPFDNGQGSQSQAPSSTAATISLPVIQTDAAINPGNSGGALLDTNAKVIGINVAIASAGQTSAGTQSGNIGVGFAIPANLAQRIGNEIIKTGKGTHGLLGASVQDVASTSASSVVGATIKTLTPGGAAEKAGLKAGDVVTEFNGVPITGSTDLTAQVRFLPAGASASLTYVRGGKSASANVTLGTLTQ